MTEPVAGPSGSRGRRQTSTLIVVLGPTGVGKSCLAMDLAQRVGGALVSADAMQVYRGCDCGTAKPDAGERARVRHELIDVADPAEAFSAGDFVRLADEVLAALWGQGIRPLLVGGTGFYIRACLRGLFPGVPGVPVLRQRLQRLADRRGVPHLHRLLRRVDPQTAARLGDGDRQRLVRALEVRFASGEPLSRHLARDGNGIWQNRERYQAVKIGLSMKREALVAGLERRVNRFFAAGLVEEVRGLLAAGVPASAQALKGIGYRESLAVVQGKMTEAEARLQTTIATRQYAKRQMTWFRREPDVHWLDAGAGNLQEKALEIIQKAG